MLIFERRQVNPFFNGEKLPKVCKKYFVNEKSDRFGHFWAKNQKGWSEELEIWHVETLDPVLKKARKQQFPPGSPSL